MELFVAKTFVKVECEEWTQALPDAEVCCSGSAAAVLAFEGLGNLDCEISIVLADNKMVKNLNREWRGVASATDVLAFPNREFCSVADLPQLFGDVVVAFGVARRDAELDNLSLENHLLHLIVHGVFHLLGFDHLRDTDAKIMEAKETQVLEELGVTDPYVEKSLTESLSEVD